MSKTRSNLKPAGPVTGRITKPRSKPKLRTGTPSLMVRLASDSKAFLVEAAKLRGLSVSDYVRTVTVAQAKREVLAAREQTIILTPEEQLVFWNALHEPVELTPAQQHLGAIMRGEL